VGIDIIGDIHGQCDKLEALLRALGYRRRAGAWRHAERRAVFVGDFIDRGPAQRRSVDTARRMVDAGSALAVLGNHEFNAIAWHTPDEARPGEYLRPHFSSKWGERNRRQHAAFLAEVEHEPALHTEIIDWFLTLPLWLELPGVRVVHACWHPFYIEWLTPLLHQGRYLTRDLMVPATAEPDEKEKDDGTPSIFKAVECLTKGIEIPLPAGHSFLDKDGIERTRVRVRWWDEAAATYRSAAMWPDADRDVLPELPIPVHARVVNEDEPILFGHYWLRGTPALLSTQRTCVDYSAGAGGPLVAYRFDGEPSLVPEHLVWVD
jgi:diadenosine tetraphosphatase ApaH/serine/threonine PP2A family protein phosphatase